MILKIQVIDADTSSCVLQGGVRVPDEIPYPPGAAIGGPITLTGLNTALDYALHESARATSEKDSEANTTPKPKWYSRLFHAAGNAIGNAKFGG